MDKKITINSLELENVKRIKAVTITPTEKTLDHPSQQEKGQRFHHI